MYPYLSILLTGAAFFIAVAVLLTAEPKVSRWLTAVAGITALLGGLVLYSYGYIVISGSVLQGILHTVFSVCRMFVGESDFGDISDAPLFSQQWVVTLCWCLHVLAFYATSSAAISLIGANALKKLRMRFSAGKPLNIIYGVNEDSVSFGQALAADGQELLVYVSEDAQPQLADTILESTSILRSDAKALAGDTSFLKSLGIRKGTRRVTLYGLCKEDSKNIAYARSLLRAMEMRGIAPQQISLVIHSQENDAAKRLQVSDTGYGYGFVTVFRDNDLAARLLMQKFPPCSSIQFDENCAAKENFEALVIGFGQLGQTVLRNLIMHGQFAGSIFRADVFEPNTREQSGYFLNRFPGILEHYDVHFHDHDGRSADLYQHLTERMDQIKYIVICTGDSDSDEEIAQQLWDFLSCKRKEIPLYQCSSGGVKLTHPQTMETESYPIYQPEILATRKLDQMAMTVNRYYQGDNSQGALADWMACDYFSRMSNRAYADFLPAVLRAAGKTEAQALSEPWTFSEIQQDNLGKMEHARWNAFHFCMGFTTMTREEYAARTEIYRQQAAQTGKGSIRIGKNLEDRTHACLIPWEELDTLSETENSITGGHVDYKQMDINNIDLLPKLLQIRNDWTK